MTSLPALVQAATGVQVRAAMAGVLLALAQPVLQRVSGIAMTSQPVRVQPETGAALIVLLEPVLSAVPQTRGVVLTSLHALVPGPTGAALIVLPEPVQFVHPIRHGIALIRQNAPAQMPTGARAQTATAGVPLFPVQHAASLILGIVRMPASVPESGLNGAIQATGKAGAAQSALSAKALRPEIA